MALNEYCPKCIYYQPDFPEMLNPTACHGTDSYSKDTSGMLHCFLAKYGKTEEEHEQQRLELEIKYLGRKIRELKARRKGLKDGSIQRLRRKKKKSTRELKPGWLRRSDAVDARSYRQRLRLRLRREDEAQEEG